MLVLALTTCTDNPAAPGHGGRAFLALQPVLTHPVDLSSFGLTIDSLRVTVVRPVADTMADTTVYFSPDSTEIHLAIPVVLRAAVETLGVHLALSAGGVVLFTGADTVPVSVTSGGGGGSPVIVPLSYSGPGAGVDRLIVTPVDTALKLSDSLRYRVAAEQGGVPVPSFYVRWTSSDTTRARITAFGVLHAPNHRDTITVIARTISGVADSTRVTFVPTPTALTIAGGNGQSGTVGQALSTALRVRVTAADLLGVKGVVVSFTAVTAGASVGTPSAVTDDSGFAQTTATVATTSGAQSFQASVVGLPTVTFGATAVAGTPTQLLVNAGNGQSGLVGTALPTAPSVVVRDQYNNPVPSVSVTFAVTGGNGSITGASATSNASGIAAVGSWTLDTIAGPNQLTATAGSLTRVFTATGTPGPISTAKSVITVGSGTVASGTGTTASLQGKDAFGNNETSGGATVAFTRSGGTSTGTFGPVTDNGNGTYSATFTGVLAGTATNIGATINTVAVTSTSPTITVTPGAASLSTSVVTVSAGTVASGAAVTVKLQAKDAAGNNLTSGGLTVAFDTTAGGGTSTGTLSGVTDNADGTYTATFTGVRAGTATAIHATIGGSAVTSAPPTVTVIPGVISTATSLVTVTSGTVASGASATITLQAKDAAGNNLTSGGSVVVFGHSGGTSTGNIAPSPATDNANGTYSATFTGVTAGTATTITATIGGIAVTSTPPTITVVPGNSATAQSIITVSADSVASGSGVTITLQARDSSGNNITTGGLTVAFSFSGGTSTGSIAPSPATDHANGTYTATFTGIVAGTATTIGGTINGSPVTSTLPTVRVIPGPPSAATSIITVGAATIVSGTGTTLTLQAKDAAGNTITKGGATVTFGRSGGTSTGSIAPSPATDNANGTYMATFTGVLAGTATNITATVNGPAVTTTLPTITVTPGAVASITVTPALDTLHTVGDTVTFQATAHDAASNLVPTSFAWTSSNAAVATVNASGLVTATGPGTAAIRATASSVTDSGRVVVLNSLHSTDITANETWTAAASPHRVTGYLRILNNATLTIEAGAVVKFDTGAGLQVGDTASGQDGMLALDGSSAEITLTANTATPTPGFWKGIELQKHPAGLVPVWRKVLIEWAGSSRPDFGGNGPCLLLADRGLEVVSLDSLHLRQCGSGGVGPGGLVIREGSVFLNHSEIDSTGSAGVAVLNGLLQVDSTTFRGAATGLEFSNAVARLGASSGNRFLGNGAPIRLTAFQLPGLLRQDTIGGNTTNHIIVTTGQPDPTAAVVTLYRQPRGPTGLDYEVTGGGTPLDIGSASGQALVLDSNVVVAFDAGGGIVVGDSATSRPGTLRSLGTNRVNAPRLTSAQAVPAPGDWVGVEIGFLAQHDTVKNLRIEYAGDSVAGLTQRFGLAIRNTAPFRLMLDSVVVAHTGKAIPDTNSAAVLVGRAGAGVEIRRSVADSNRGYGFLIGATPVRLVDDTARGNYVGVLGAVAGGGSIAADSAVGTPDSIAGNMLGPGNVYPLHLFPGSLPMLYANSVAGNQRDTLLLGVTPPPIINVIVRTQGQLPPPSGPDPNRLLVPAVLPQVPGHQWRVVGPVTLDSTGFLRINPDTVVFDSAGGIAVGGTAPAVLQVDGANRGLGAGFYKLFTATPGHARWGGVEFDYVAGSGNLTPVVFRKVIVEKAGQFIPPSFGCDCNGIAVAGLRVFDQTSGVSFLLDSLIVRQSITIALDVNRGGTGGVLSVQHSQFYQNPWNPMIRSPGPLELSITTSDLYHYHAQVIQSSFAGTDSVDAVGNWWGDVSGPDSTFSFADSLGRASFDGNAVRYRPYATGPFFGVGPAVTLVAARDTFLFAGDTVLSAVGQRDSLRVRVLDAEGRGAGGGTVSWSTTSGSLSPGGSDVDVGGRAGAQWHTGQFAGPWTATANAVGAPVVFPVDLLPGNTDPATVNWQLDAAYTQGQVTGPKAVKFTSTNRPALVVTGAFDTHGNHTRPNEVGFADPGGPVAFYGTVDSLKGDSIFFHTTVTTPPTFVLRGLYEFGAGGQDSVLITMNAIAAHVRIDRDVSTPGSVDTLPNPVVINALCRNGYPPGGPCQQEFHAFVVDSGNTPVGNGSAGFLWHTRPSPDTTISDTTRGAPANDTAFVTAHDNGTTWLVVVDSTQPASPTFTKRDSVPILVQQVATSISLTPFSDTLLVGQTMTVRGAALDLGGDTVRTLAVHWRIDEAPPHLSIIDSSVAGQVTVRLDSTPYGQTAVTAFAVRAPGDTLFAAAYVFNPALARINVGSVPFGIGINANTNRVYVANASSGDVSVIDGASDAVLTTVHVGFNANSVAVDAVLNKIYVTTDSAGASLAIIDGLTNSVTTLDAGTSPQGVAVDSINHVVYIATLLNPGPHGVLVPVDATADTFLVADTVSLPSSGMGVAFNPVNGRVYVAHNNDNTVSVIDPATHTIAQTIVVGASPTTLAVDPVMNLVYVTVNGTGNVAIIQGATGIVTDSVSTGTPEGIAVDPNLHRVYVGTTYPYGGLTAFENGPAGLTAPRFIPIAQSPYDNPQRVAYNGANGKVYAVQPSFNHVTRLQF